VSRLSTQVRYAMAVGLDESVIYATNSPTQQTVLILSNSAGASLSVRQSLDSPQMSFIHAGLEAQVLQYPSSWTSPRRANRYGRNAPSGKRSLIQLPARSSEMCTAIMSRATR
jgi:hypothetical protein